MITKLNFLAAGKFLPLRTQKPDPVMMPGSQCELRQNPAFFLSRSTGCQFILPDYGMKFNIYFVRQIIRAWIYNANNEDKIS